MSEHIPSDGELAVTQAYGYLLECTMATYEGLCLRKSASKSEIRRHESIIKSSFTSMSAALKRAAETSKAFHPSWHTSIRVKKVLAMIDAEGQEGVSRYLLEHSFPNPK
jgi:hypothetical protein